MLQLQGTLFHANLPYWGIVWTWGELQMNAMSEAWTSEFLLHPSKAVLDELATAQMPEAFWACVNTQGLQTHRHARDHGWLTGTQAPWGLLY